jgi:hypothetical protein
LEVIDMDKDLWEAITSKQPLDDEELDNIRKDMLGVGLDDLDDGWRNMVDFSYNIAQYDEVKSVEELGAATSIVIVVFDEDDIEKPRLENENLLYSMARQPDYIGEIARFVLVEKELRLNSAGKVDGREGTIQIEVFT